MGRMPPDASRLGGVHRRQRPARPYRFCSDLSGADSAGSKQRTPARSAGIAEIGLPTLVCTIYNGALASPDEARRARVALTVFNDAILARHGIAAWLSWTSAVCVDLGRLRQSDRAVGPRRRENRPCARARASARLPSPSRACMYRRVSPFEITTAPSSAELRFPLSSGPRFLFLRCFSACRRVRHAGCFTNGLRGRSSVLRLVLP
jgi:hypothetical protein